MDESVSFRLPPELRREFDRFCETHRRPAGEVLRAALKRYMQAEELRRLRQNLRPHAAAQGFVSDEDLFEQVS